MYSDKAYRAHIDAVTEARNNKNKPKPRPKRKPKPDTRPATGDDPFELAAASMYKNCVLGKVKKEDRIPGVRRPLKRSILDTDLEFCIERFARYAYDDEPLDDYMFDMYHAKMKGMLNRDGIQVVVDRETPHRGGSSSSSKSSSSMTKAQLVAHIGKHAKKQDLVRFADTL